MGLFSKIFSKTKELIIKSSCDGEVILMSKVKDETFSKDMMGKGFAIIPKNGEFVAPISGQITLIADTGHALSIRNKSGLEVLIHIGIETVKINSNKKPNDPLIGFKPLVQVGSRVAANDPVMEVDLDVIKKHKCDLTTPIVLLNQISNNNMKFEDLKFEYIKQTGNVLKGEDILKIKW